MNANIITNGNNIIMDTQEVQLAKMKADQKQHIQVFARLRPITEKERLKHPHSVLDCPGSREVVVKDRPGHTKVYTFDRVFNHTSTQIDVYKNVVAPLVQEVLLGYNCTVFAYGQTGTGKTFTMAGERSDIELSWENDPNSGIVPRALSQLFEDLRLQNAEFTVRVSLLELYNEELFDLLSPTEECKAKNLRLFEDSSRKGSVIIQGLEEVTVHNKNEVYKIMERGTARRHTASTQMNANSSRSHTIFTITVHIKESNIEGEELVKIGKMNLVDLAGSESIGRSGAVNKHAGEAGSINRSLLTLGRVITALCEHAPHIPYRESKLTRLLQDSLGGRTKTSIIATISPAFESLEETLSTLEYAHRAKDITNKPEINQKMTKKAIMKEYTEEIERLRRDLNACREKNGIFLEKEDYEVMVAKIEAQAEELNGNTLHQKTMEDIVAQKDLQMVEMQNQLRDAQENLAILTNVVNEVRGKLHEAHQELENVRTDRDQQSYLVQHHVKTELELSSQAQKLLATTEDATFSLENLYKKLDRKKQVEVKNLAAGNRMTEDVVEGLSEVTQGIEDFRVRHAKHCGDMRMGFQSILQEKQTEVDEMKRTMDTLVETIYKMQERMTNSAAKEATRIQKVHDEFGNHCNSVSDWGDETALKTSIQAGKLTEFWDTTYLLDTPSGATPQRKSYQYPRLLCATSPHEQLIGRFINNRIKKENEDMHNGNADEFF